MKTHIMLLALTLAAGLFVGMSNPSHSEPAEDGYAVATFAGGCFWCMEGPFDKLDGVVSTISGYTGGQTSNPTYEQVSAGGTGHAEAVQITYDPQQIGYRELLAVYWRNTDPTTPDAQFCDHGDQYRPAIFYHDEEQRRLAEASKQELDRTKTFTDPLVTEITRFEKFYPAEDYHQNFYQKNPVRYKLYRFTCGRDTRLTTLWGNLPS